MKNLLVVDMQPRYHRQCKSKMKKGVGAVNKAFKKGGHVIMFWVEDYDGFYDSFYNLQDYWVSYGLHTNFLEKIQYVKKEYGFLQSWMSVEGADNMVIRVISEMVSRGLQSSTQLPENIVGHFISEMGITSGWNGLIKGFTPVSIPPFDFDLFRGKSWMSFGGGRYACLREIELLLKGHGIEITRNDKLSWGPTLEQEKKLKKLRNWKL